MSKLIINCDNELIDALSLAQAVYKALGQRVKLSAEITFCNEEEIKQINARERNKDEVTDVLSFPAAAPVAGEIIKKRNYPFDVDPESNSVFLGCIIICLPRAEEQAAEYGHSLAREVNYLAVHGMLHLFGYDHEQAEDKEQMRELEEIILTEIGQTRGE